MDENKILWLALNAKYSHTSLSVRYLREAMPGSEIMELTINHQLLALGRPTALLSAYYPSLVLHGAGLHCVQAVAPYRKITPRSP